MPVAGTLWTGIIWWSQEVIHLWILAAFSILGVAIFTLTTVSNSAGRIVYIVWHTMGAIFEVIISFISTVIMYYLTIFPIGLIMKLFGRNPLPLEFDRDRKSYWKDCQESNDLKRYFRQF